MTAHASSRQGSASAMNQSDHEQVKTRSVRPSASAMRCHLSGSPPRLRSDDLLRIAAVALLRGEHIAVEAAGADLEAAAPRVPGSFGPGNDRSLAHDHTAFPESDANDALSPLPR